MANHLHHNGMALKIDVGPAADCPDQGGAFTSRSAGGDADLFRSALRAILAVNALLRAVGFGLLLGLFCDVNCKGLSCHHPPIRILVSIFLKAAALESG